MITRLFLIVASLCFLLCEINGPDDRSRSDDRHDTLVPAVWLAKSLSISDIDSIIAIVTGDSIDDSLVFPLSWDAVGHRFAGVLRVPADGSMWNVTVILLDTVGRRIGQGSKVLLRTDSVLVMDTIGCTSALPFIMGLHDTVVAAGQLVLLRPTANDASPGSIVRYEWKIGTAPFAETGSADTSFTAPSTAVDSLLCILRVTDNDGNMVSDTTVVTVLPRIPAGMCYLPGATFTMGYAQGAADESNEHRVSLSPFCIDTVEVTQARYSAIMTRNPSQLIGDNLPVSNLTWYDAVLYCNARSRADTLDTVYTYSQIIGMAGNGCELTDVTADFTKPGYRLPTEAEWEYACRAGTMSPYPWGSDTAEASQYAWYAPAPAFIPHPVGLKASNRFGLHDMIGNVSEWCHDAYDATYYATSPTVDPRGTALTGNTGRVVRGDCWEGSEVNLRATVRSSFPPSQTDIYLGFRCVRSAP